VSRRSKAEAARQRARVWKPLQRGHRVPMRPERIEAYREYVEALGGDPDRMESMLADPDAEVWMNDVYQVAVERVEDGTIEHLSIKRLDRQPDIPWRDLQRLKNEVAGEDVEAIEIYPAESRLVDTANQRWLWCFPPGFVIPRGFNSGRMVSGPEEAARLGAVQAPLE
jgi:hypothetical protein